MKTVKVDRNELLEKVRKNRAKHEEAYKQAKVVFRQEAIEKLKEALKAAESDQAIPLYLGLSEPEEHLADYDQIITMLEMSVDSFIELEHSLFAQYVMDKWSWAGSFERNTASYSAKFRG